MKTIIVRFWYWFVSCLPIRIRCVLGHHYLSDSERLNPLPGVDWRENEFISPLDGEKVKCYRRYFAYRQTCFHCLKEFTFIGYDQKPFISDSEFDKKHKNASTSKGLHLTEEEYNRHVRKLRTEFK